MHRQILITGGAGFVGSHLANELLNSGYRVRVLDNLSPQVHGPEQKRPAYLNSEVELQVGDVRDKAAVARALKGIDAVYHLVAIVGVGEASYAAVAPALIDDIAPVERNIEHRFFDITEDLTVLVFFAPPEGSSKKN